MLTGEISPTSGSIFIKGKQIPKNIQDLYGQIGYCPQTDPIFDNLTVKEHLEFYGSIKGMSAEMMASQIDYIMD